jgi:hypothetical protein
MPPIPSGTNFPTAHPKTVAPPCRPPGHVSCEPIEIDPSQFHDLYDANCLDYLELSDVAKLSLALSA